MITTPKQNVPDRDDEDGKRKALHHMLNLNADNWTQVRDLVDSPEDKRDMEEIKRAHQDAGHAIELFELGLISPEMLLETVRSCDIFAVKIHRPFQQVEVRITTRRKAKEIQEDAIPEGRSKTLDPNHIILVEILTLSEFLNLSAR